MTAAINQPVTISEGDVFTQRFPILDGEGNSVILTNPSAYYGLFMGAYLVDGDIPILEKNTLPNGGMRIINEGGIWVVYVDFVPADTIDRIGLPMSKHYYELKIVDGSIEQTVATGILTILPTGVRP